MKCGRWGGLLAAAVTVGLAVSGCSSSKGMSSTPGAASTDGAAPKGVTLTLWHNTADSKALLDLYKAYEAKSGNKINLVDIPSDGFENTAQTKWATGARPDILEYHGIGSFIAPFNPAKNMLDLSNLAFVAKEGDLAKVAGNVNGKVYAASIGFPQIFGIYYNKKVFSAAGLKAPQNLADLKSDCQVFKGKGITPMYEAGGSGWPQQLLSFDLMGEYNVGDVYTKAIIDGSQKVTDPNGPFVQALTNYKALQTAGCFNKDATSAKYEDSIKAVYEGKAAMVSQHSDNVATFNSDAGGDTAKVDATIGFVGVSTTKPIANYAPTPLGTYYVPNTGDSTKQRAAVDFVNFITGDGYAAYVKEAGAIPVLSGVEAPPLQALAQDVQKAWENTAITPNGWPGFTQFSTESGKLLAGQESPAAVAKNMQAAFEQAKAASGS
jgi:raffinose/stachyose/melibiose transport system substrate-binding protein